MKKAIIDRNKKRLEKPFSELSENEVLQTIDACIFSIKKKLDRGSLIKSKGENISFHAFGGEAYEGFTDCNLSLNDRVIKNDIEDLRAEAWLQAVAQSEKYPSDDGFLNIYRGTFIAWYRLKKEIFGKEQKSGKKVIGYRLTMNIETAANNLQYSLTEEKAIGLEIDLYEAMRDENDFLIVEGLRNGYTRKEISDKIGISQAAICKRLKRLLDEIKK